MPLGDIPTNRGALQMTSAICLSLKVHVALQYLIRNFFRIENVVSVRLAQSIHKLPPVAHADSCTLVHYGNDVNPGLHSCEAEGATLNIHDITGLAHSRIIQCQCLKSTKPQAGFDQDVTKFDYLGDAPTQDNDAREVPKAEPPREDGRLLTTHEESKADLEAHYGCAARRLTGEKELPVAAPKDDI
eukprot:5172200-Pyramimonas_sp.AAC.1